MTSYRIPDVLEPISSETLNRPQPSPKRRKITHNDEADVAKIPSTSTITIRPHAASPSDKPITLEPITTLPRALLPLTWLDTSSLPSSQVACISHLFVSDNSALRDRLQNTNENENENHEPVVLVARLVSDDSRLYVIERVRDGIYSLSRLGWWVNEGEVLVASKSSAPLMMSMSYGRRSPSVKTGESGSWWQVARIDEPLAGSGLLGKEDGFGVSVVFGGADGFGRGSDVDSSGHHLSPPDSGGQPGGGFRHATTVDMAVERSSSANVLTPATAMSREQSENENNVDADGGSDSKSPQEMLDGLREQYLQALYISKTSLAYFAKGPLARCRAAFQPLEEASKRPVDLLEHYREAILTAKKMDLKYRETLPSIIRNVMLSVSDDENIPRARKRKSKKKTIGKNGLYPEEEEYVHKWWKDRSLTEHATMSVESNREAEAKKHVADLRLRETQLQILVILEAMSLEPIASDNQGNDDEKQKTAKKSKSKKAQDLNVLLELHLDRLCIWHAVSSDEAIVSESAKAQDGNHLAGKKVESDAVRDFCTEVMIPFYAPRLPDKCKLITRKFGISGATSVPSSKQVSHSKHSTSSQPESGSNAKRQQPQSQQQKQKQEEPHKSRRTLQRVLTDEITASQKRRHPSLTRASAEPSQQLQQLETKRDSIEPLLPSLPHFNVRGGIQKPKRAGNREVDLNSAAKQHETKLRKMQFMIDQKKELDAAISTLRRPNRELVAKDMAHDADKRLSSGGGGSSRKPRNPVRNPLGHGVQVMATPKGSRRRNFVEEEVGVPLFPPRRLAQTSSMSALSSVQSARPNPESSSAFVESDAAVVPSSTLRPGPSFRPMNLTGPMATDGNIFGPDTNQGDNAVGGGSAIQETPCRRPPPRPAGRERVPLNEGAANIRRFSGNEGVENNRPSSGNIFRVPNLPSTAYQKAGKSVPTSDTDNNDDNNNDNEIAPPSTPVPVRRMGRTGGKKLWPQQSEVSLATGDSNNVNASSPVITETPLAAAAAAASKDALRSRADLRSRCSPPAVMATPVKGGGMERTGLMPETPEKSIYERLGWDEDDELAI